MRRENRYNLTPGQGNGNSQVYFHADVGYNITMKVIENGGADVNREELTFTVFLIHKLADAWNKAPSDVYKILKDSGILEDYILPCYDTLHTLGSQYLVEDITEFVRERGMVNDLIVNEPELFKENYVAESSLTDSLTGILSDNNSINQMRENHLKEKY